MINYTTPTISLTVESVDLSGMDVYVSLEQMCIGRRFAQALRAVIPLERNSILTARHTERRTRLGATTFKTTTSQAYR